MLTGGGTGGHVFPALAIAEELRRRDPQLLLRWVGRAGTLEEEVARRHDFPFRGIAVAPWPRRGRVRQVYTAGRLAWGVVQGLALLRRVRPQAVVGVGGYVSLPLGFAAQRLGIPTILHEQNAHLGLANRVLAEGSSCLCLSFAETAGAERANRTRVTGNPVRQGFIAPPEPERARAQLGLQAGRPVLLVVGGSQGAHTLNAAVAGALEAGKLDEVHVLWATGRSAYERWRTHAAAARPGVQVMPFIDDMPAAASAADCIVSRAGASSTAEIAAMGRASVLVPYPHATDNHQEANARTFEAVGAAEVLLDRDCTGDALAGAVLALLRDEPRRSAMAAAARKLAQPLAADLIAETVLDIVFARTPD